MTNSVEHQDEDLKVSKKGKDLEILDKSVNELLNLNENEPFKFILVHFLKKIISKKPFLDPEHVKQEMEKMNVSLSFSIVSEDDLSAYYNIIDTIQGYRDRLTELLNRAENEFVFLDSNYEHLYKMWTGKFSRLSSDKRREGEAEYILHFMFDEKETRRCLYNNIKNVYVNMKNKMDAVSRKITIYQEVRRFWGTSNMPEDNRSKPKKIESSGWANVPPVNFEEEL